MDPATETNPGSHAEHVLAPVPATPVKEPAAHCTHSVARGLAENEPSAHDTHVLASVAPGVELALPAAHGEHDARSGETNSPATHGTHEELPAAADEPDAHCSHVVALDCAGLGEKRPEAHRTHAEDTPSAYSPASQREHTLEPASATNPELHAWHVDSPRAPTTVLALPTAHIAHEEARASTKRPAVHCAHAVEPSGATKPSGHGVHDVASIATNVAPPSPHVAHVGLPAAAANVPAGHAWHTLATVAPTISLARPAGHNSHSARSLDTNSPATHGSHTALPAGAAEPVAHVSHVRESPAPTAAENFPAAHCTHDDALAST